MIQIKEGPETLSRVAERRPNRYRSGSSPTATIRQRWSLGLATEVLPNLLEYPSPPSSDGMQFHRTRRSQFSLAAAPRIQKTRAFSGAGENPFERRTRKIFS